MALVQYGVPLAEYRVPPEGIRLEAYTSFLALSLCTHSILLLFIFSCPHSSILYPVLRKKKQPQKTPMYLQKPSAFQQLKRNMKEVFTAWAATTCSPMSFPLYPVEPLLHLFSGDLQAHHAGCSLHKLLGARRHWS